MELFTITTTVATAQDAQCLANAILDRRLAACIQCEPVTSHYRWKGNVVQEGEVRVACKTTAGAHAAVVAFIKAQHPYRIPEILVHTVAVTAEYGSWVLAEVKHGAAR